MVFNTCSPVGAYFEKGFKPVSLLVDTRYTRAWPGGTGDTKSGANYAQTILPQSLGIVFKFIIDHPMILGSQGLRPVSLGVRRQTRRYRGWRNEFLHALEE